MHRDHDDHTDERGNCEDEDQTHTILEAVGEPADTKESGTTDGGRRHAEQQTLTGGPAEALGDNVAEGRVTTVWNADAHDDEEHEPGANVLEGLLDLVSLDVLVVRAGLVHADTLERSDPFLLG